MTRLERSEIASIYGSKLFGPESGRTVGPDDSFISYILAYLPAQGRGAILDAGCGNGRYGRTLSKLGRPRVVGIDLHRDVGKDLPYVCGSIDALPFPDASFEGLVSCSVIFYLPDPAVGFREYFRVLEPGGHALVTVHTKWSFYTLERIIWKWTNPAKVTHLRAVRFRASYEYVKMLREAGFEVLEIDGFIASYVWARIRWRLVALAPWLDRWLPGKERKREHFGPRTRRSRWYALYRSIVSYEAVLVARKPPVHSA